MFNISQVKFRRGFTLIELLVVIAIIGILASVALASFVDARAAARFSKMKEDMRQMALAAELFVIDNQLYPCDGWPGEDPGIRPLSGARAVEVGTICSDATTLVGGGYLPVLPEPPCAGWTYDWENWGPISNLPTGDDDSHIVRISLRANTGISPEPSVYHYCILDTHDSTEYSCGGQVGDADSTLGGQDITLESGLLYCNV